MHKCGIKCQNLEGKVEIHSLICSLRLILFNAAPRAAVTRTLTQAE